MKISSTAKVCMIIISFLIVYAIGILSYKSYLYDNYQNFDGTALATDGDPYLIGVLSSKEYKRGNNNVRHNMLCNWAESYAQRNVGRCFHCFLGFAVFPVSLLCLITNFKKDSDPVV